MLSLPRTGLTLGIGSHVFRVLSLEDPSRRMFDDCAGMHKYLLCTVSDRGSAYY
jgi:hypothetical protein